MDDRVNSIRGPGEDLHRRPLKSWEPEAPKKAGHVVTPGGDLVYPSRVKEVMRDGRLLLDYDHGGEGFELPQWVWPRAQMPWRPKDVPLVLNLRRNLGRGVVLEGLHVRWWYVSRLLQALTAYAPNGQVWRIGGQEGEPMHKFYDPRMFDVLDEPGMRSRLDRTSDIAELPDELKTAEDFSIAGFRVKVCESESADVHQSQVWVEQKTFCTWLQLGNLQVSGAVASWWTGLYSIETSGDGEEKALKSAGDDTCVEFFQRLCERVKVSDPEAVQHGTIRLDALQRWLQDELGGEVLGIEHGTHLLEQLIFEFGVVEDLKPGVQESGSMEEAVDRADEDEQAKSLAEHLVYGWPNKAVDPVTVRDAGRFVKSHPLDFPMGVGDLYDPDRPRKVSVLEWVQHLLRYRDGRFVRGLRGQRVLWAMVNELLLSEARQRGYAVYRSVRRRIGFGIQGGGVLTKGDLRTMLKDDQSVRLITNQLMCLGRDVRTSPMYWSYEGKKLDAAVKHLSWCPPWVDKPVDDEDSDLEASESDKDVVQSSVTEDVSSGCHAGGTAEGVSLCGDGLPVNGGPTSPRQRAPKKRLVSKHIPSPRKFVPTSPTQRVPKKRLGFKYIGSNRLCEDTVGLGRTATMWWTQNCKYNAVHDVHRLNIDGKNALEALDTGVESYVGVRQKFARDCPDLVAYQIVLRTELNMRIVMPSVIKHNLKWPYLSMTRFETGPGGNLHAHGFSAGKKPPKMPRRVKAKQVVDGDEAVSLFFS